MAFFWWPHELAATVVDTPISVGVNLVSSPEGHPLDQVLQEHAEMQDQAHLDASAARWMPRPQLQLQLECFHHAPREIVFHTPDTA